MARRRADEPARRQPVRRPCARRARPRRAHDRALSSRSPTTRSAPAARHPVHLLGVRPVHRRGQARSWPDVPVLKPNEAMIDEAAALARKRGIGLWSRRSRRRSRRCRRSFRAERDRDAGACRGRARGAGPRRGRRCTTGSSPRRRQRIARDVRRDRARAVQPRARRGRSARRVARVPVRHDAGQRGASLQRRMLGSTLRPRAALKEGTSGRGDPDGRHLGSRGRQSAARIFDAVGPTRALEEIASYAHPEGRAHDATSQRSAGTGVRQRRSGPACAWSRGAARRSRRRSASPRF